MLKRRAFVMAILILVSFGALVSRLAQLQLVEGPVLARASVEQRLRVLSTPAPRGLIYSSDGVLLATNRPAFVVQYMPIGEPLTDEALLLLEDIIGVPPESVREVIRRQRNFMPYAPVNLKVDLEPAQYTAIMEHRHLLPGIRVIAQPVRRYPEESLAAHALGYVLTIDESELRTFETRSGKQYESRDVVGKAGLERAAEFDLQGIKGDVLVEVDAYGRLVESVTGHEPVSGEVVYSTIDTRLQRTAEWALAVVTERMQAGRDPLPYNQQAGRYLNLWEEGTLLPADRARPGRTYPDAQFGSVVVMDVRTGAVLAMASHPSFDPNVFTTAPLHLPGTDGAREWLKQWTALINPASGQPLLNRTVSQISAPGSTFKMVTALAALEAGLSPHQTQSCSGRLSIFGQSYGCWTTHGGGVNLHRGIAESCNVYFYHASLFAGIDAISSMASELGLGNPTGIVGLGSGEESRGVRPSREWKQKTIGEPWYPGETLMAGIGQGYHAYSPLQMANYVATIANGGLRYRPYLLDYIEDHDGHVIHQVIPEVVHELSVTPSNLARVQDGMAAGTRPGGTAFWRFWDYPKPHPLTGKPVEIATKTGTAEVGSGAGRRDPHGWFVAYAPVEDPEIAIAVVIDHGGGGSLAGAPVARAIFEEYFGFSSALAAIESWEFQTGDSSTAD